MFETLFDFFKSHIYLCSCMRSHQRKSYQRILRRNSRRNNRINKNTLIKQIASYPECFLIITNKQRNNRRTCIPYLQQPHLTTYTSESFQSIIRHVPQVGYTFRFTLHNIQSSTHRRSRSRCNTCTENIGTRVMT